MKDCACCLLVSTFTCEFSMNSILHIHAIDIKFNGSMKSDCLCLNFCMLFCKDGNNYIFAFVIL